MPGHSLLDALPEQAPGSRVAFRKPAARICMLVLTPAATDWRIIREATALRKAGYAITIVDVEIDSARPARERHEGIDFLHTFDAPRNTRNYGPVSTWPWLLSKAARMFRTLWPVLSTPAQAYHAHDITALPACYLAAVLRGKALVFDAHELPLTQDYIMRRPLLTRFSRGLLRLMMRRCTQTITVSPPLVSELSRLYGGPTATLVRNIPEYQEPPRDRRLHHHFGLPPSTKIALYQGGFQSNRSLDILVRAATSLKTGTVIVLMGAGSHREHLADLIAELRVGDRVKLKEFVPYAELLAWTGSADLGLTIFTPDVSLSIRHCLPNKLFEYLMAGVPVLSTRLDAVVDLTHHYGVGRCVESTDPQAVAQAIDSLLADSNELHAMRERALRACKSELRWDVEALNLIAMYRPILT
jgi:glycosyltransferase involved in cell wall biosynthesis